MRLGLLGSALAAALMLAACDPQAAQQAETETAPPDIAGFDDDGCIGILLLQRTAVIEGRAQGDEAALTAALESWRSGARAVFSADELAQYEASSFAVEDDQPPETIAERAGACVANAPNN